jgi:CspA family cold shock protein
MVILEVKFLIGEVKRWLDGRGYGFIDVEDQEKDVFVHHSEIKDAYSLMQGQKVEFEVETTYRGPKALNVRIVG